MPPEVPSLRWLLCPSSVLSLLLVVAAAVASPLGGAEDDVRCNATPMRWSTFRRAPSNDECNGPSRAVEANGDRPGG